MGKSRLFTFFLLLSLLVFPNFPSHAQDSFGSGLSICPAKMKPVQLVNPAVVQGAQCSTAGIQAALDNGGHIRLDCGSTPIAINATLVINPNVDTVLDGGGVVTLDGLNAVRLLEKGWHDPQQHASVTVTLQNIRLINGRAPGGSETGETSGGAILIGHPGTRLHILNSTFENNNTSDMAQPDNQGGAIFVHNSYEIVISGSVFRDNQAGNGGAIGNIASGIWIENSVFEDNRAGDDQPGGIVRGYGGAIAIDGLFNDYNPDSSHDYRVCGSRFEGNLAVRGGGAIDSVISDGFGSQASFLKNTFLNNQATGYPDPNKPGDYQFGQGGAIYHVEDDWVGASGEDNFDLLDSVFQGNQARKQGGAVWVSILGNGRMRNVTFEGNSTSAPHNTVGQGGAVAITQGNFLIAHATFANNHAAYQGGAMHGGGDDNQITLANTIFYNNTLNVQDQPSTTEWQGYHTNRTMIDGGSNLQYPRLKPDFNNDVNNLITDNPIFADPLLQPLADNGGPTWTMALQSGSPAINAGRAVACLPVDQRGYMRVGNCDLGAYEFGAQPFVPTDFVYLAVVRK